MKKSIIIVTFFYVLATCCKYNPRGFNMPQGSNVNIINSIDTFPTSSTTKIESKIKNSNISMNTFGNQKLVNTNFPQEWKFADIDSIRWENSLINFGLEEVVNDSSFLLLDSTLSVGVGKAEPYSSEHEKEFVCYYDNLLVHAFYDTVNITTPPEPVFSGTIPSGVKFIAYKNHYEAGNVTRPMGATQYKFVDICTFDEGNRLIDGLTIYYDAYFPYGGQQKQFFIDENAIIYLKYFRNSEEYRKFIRLEKWKIKPNGKIVRFYMIDGAYEDEEESGIVENHFRSGQWIEKRKNGFVNKETYLEAKYKEGESTGDWKYYELLVNWDEDGNIIPKSIRKGEILYTERYTEGKLIERNFIKEQNH